jgi:hypothetical protein
VAGKKITVGRASVSIGPELERALDNMISTTYVEIKRAVESLTSDVTENAKDNWYKNVIERTGKTGGGIDYEMRLGPNILRGVVFSHDKSTYYVRRAGPFSRLGQRVTNDEFSNVMSTYRATGQIPPGYTVQRWTRTRRAVGVFKIDPPGSAPRDGKNLWKVLVNDYGKRLAKERVGEIDKAMQAVARRLSA